MDINEAALELKRIEIIEDQIVHLRQECSGTTEKYCESCNRQALELIKSIPIYSRFKIGDGAAL